MQSNQISSSSSAPGASKPPGSQDQINFTLLRQHYYKQFVKFFEEKPGFKSVYIEESLLKVLSFVIGNFPESARVK